MNYSDGICTILGVSHLKLTYSIQRNYVTSTQTLCHYFICGPWNRNTCRDIWGPCAPLDLQHQSEPGAILPWTPRNHYTDVCFQSQMKEKLTSPLYLYLRPHQPFLHFAVFSPRFFCSFIFVIKNEFFFCLHRFIEELLIFLLKIKFTYF